MRVFILRFSVRRHSGYSSGPLLTPEGNKSGHDNHEVDLPKQGLQHGKGLAHISIGNQVAVPYGGKCRVAKKQIIVNTCGGLLGEERSAAEVGDGGKNEGE